MKESPRLLFSFSDLDFFFCFSCFFLLVVSIYLFLQLSLCGLSLCAMSSSIGDENALLAKLWVPRNSLKVRARALEALAFLSLFCSSPFHFFHSTYSCAQSAVRANGGKGPIGKFFDIF